MFGIIHLILLLLRALSGGAGNRGAGQQLGAKRRVRAGPVTMECPFCQTLGVAACENLYELQSSGWVRQMDIYQCAKCRRTINAQAMQNDGTGVLIAKTWECPACRNRNLASRADCATCGAPRQ